MCPRLIRTRTHRSPMSIFSFNPFKSAADITMQQLKLYNDSRSQDELLRGTKQEVLQRWARF